MQYYDYLTEFIFREDVLQKADVIFIPGSPYGEIAINAARLYREGLAPRVVPSGRYSITCTQFEGARSPKRYQGCIFDTESDFLKRILMDEGVPETAILQEKEAAYTYQNAVFTREKLEREGIAVEKAILSCQAYHAKRCLMYYQLVFPHTRFFVSPVETRGINRENWHTSREGIRLVLKEVEHCASQFYEIMEQGLQR